MIFNGILILVAVAVTAWVAFIGFTDGWTLKLVALLIFGTTDSRCAIRRAAPMEAEEDCRQSFSR